MVKIHGEVECLACGYQMISSSPIDAGYWTWDKINRLEIGVDQDTALWDENPKLSSKKS